MKRTPIILVALLVVGLLSIPGSLGADPSGAETLESGGTGVALDFVWVLVCAFLVFIMQAGFAMLEAGFSRSKNVTNVLMKNILDFSAGSIAFFAIGYVLLMGTDAYGLFGTDGWLLFGDAYDVNTMLLWFFMMVFAATAATIVSGAIAERPKFSTYIIVSVVITALIYPLYGHWLWGGGWLASLDFLVDLGGGYGALDFAGSGVVHAVGGYVALAGCLIIGPRIGRYDSQGRPRPIFGHNITIAVLGLFILWFGWYGFNPGSTLSAHELRISAIAVNTTLSAAGGTLAAMSITWYKFGKPDVTMTINGAIGGLVGITAGCAWVAPWASIVIGVVSGFIAVYGYRFLERKGIDDVVGAIPVHGFAGTWGLIALGLFADGAYGNYGTAEPLITGLLYGNAGFFLVQGFSALVNMAWAFGAGYAMFYLLDKIIGLRITSQEELEGLDITEHGAITYPEFVTMDLKVRGGRDR